MNEVDKAVAISGLLQRAVKASDGDDATAWIRAALELDAQGKK